MKSKVIFFLIWTLFCSVKVNSQEEKINWINFEQLEDSLAIKPKKVFISFYADWCVYCKKMNKVAFKDSNIINLLNTKYYAVKMNAESKDTIIFDGKKYANNQLKKSRRPTHEIPLLLASKKGKAFTLPVNIILDKNFKLKNRYFEYLSTKKLLLILTSE